MRHLAGALVVLMAGAATSPAAAQVLSQRGFVDVRGTLFPQDASNDDTNVVGDLRGREEIFVRATEWLRLAGAFETLANTHDQVDASWRLDLDDRGALRPALSLRRLTATLSRGALTLDAGRQFIRWGKADIITPTDRFAPRDYLNVFDADFLAVWGARVVYATGAETFEGVVVPHFTPSRLPLLNQRWSVVPAGITIVEATGGDFPERAQVGARWAHVGSGLEYSLALFDGFNHLPNVEFLRTPLMPDASIPPAIVRTYPRMRMYGGDGLLSTRWVTLKGEAGYFTSTTSGTPEYVLYVAQVERQTGEWLLIGGYAGSVITGTNNRTSFAPDLGTARSFLGRASYTIGPTRRAAVEGAIRQDGDGAYVKGEYSTSRGAHWSATVSGTLIRGEASDFIGQFSDNSNLALSLRYSF